MSPVRPKPRHNGAYTFPEALSATEKLSEAESATHPGRRGCTATNKAGDPCQSVALNGSSTCLVHTPGAAAERGFGGAQRTPVPKVMERMLERVDERVDDILGAYFDALGADDTELRMKAADRILNRTLGTPKQSVDVAHSGGLTLEGIYREALDQTDTMLPEGEAE